jgi:hypothetical protein
VRQAVRQDNSFAKKQEPHPARLLVAPERNCLLYATSPAAPRARGVGDPGGNILGFTQMLQD